MKIKDFSGSAGNIKSITIKEDRKVNTTGSTTFHNNLKQAEGTEYEEHIRDLAQKIADQGEKLGKKVDIRELKIYKALISEFLDEAVGSSMKFSKQSLLDRRGRHKVYALIKNVNTELDALTKDVLSGEKDNISILKRIDDIRGLILDMTL